MRKASDSECRSSRYSQKGIFPITFPRINLTLFCLERIGLWMALDGCSGRRMKFFDMDECLIELAGKIDLVYSPLVGAKEFPPDANITLVAETVSKALPLCLQVALTQG